jgi:glycosyltransferase involved in cell wall biosynthesis
LKILLGSHHFFPSAGGIETASELLAGEFLKLGHEVHVVTQTSGKDEFPFPVIRRPSVLELLRQVRWCDVFLQNNISLRTMWPVLFVRRPLFIIHQTWITDESGRVGWLHRLKLLLLRLATSFAISDAVASRLPVPSQTIGNPYDDDVFKDDGTGSRPNDVIFVGRLVSDKGLDVLIEAVARLRDLNLPTHLTVAGEGPERVRLEKQVTESNLQSLVTFLGQRSSRELAQLLNQHKILVVPSRWPEPFGIVALEGIASGCVVVGSAGGGLAEAIGPCGELFQSGDSAELADILRRLLQNPSELESLRKGAPSHLARFTKRNVATLCLKEMASAT